jgi:hypothetical protein
LVVEEEVVVALEGELQLGNVVVVELVVVGKVCCRHLIAGQTAGAVEAGCGI